jgi:glycosyltransferase involved in cell wall biosynthesis
VDVDFWTPAQTSAGDYVLAVGNDGRRDYATLVRAAADWNLPVKIVTSRALPEPLPPNITHLRGSWHRPAVSDAELRELYRGALAVVVSLEDSIQPSGQSVALQAMACGCPVVLTRTRGLWTGNDFHEGEHLLLVEPSSPAALKTAVERLAADPAFAQRMGAAARDAVRQHGRMDAFASRLESVIALAQSAANTR